LLSGERPSGFLAGHGVVGQLLQGQDQCRVIQVALSEELAARSELDDMAACFTLERAETVSFGGTCPICEARYKANQALLDEVSA